MNIFLRRNADEQTVSNAEKDVQSLNPLERIELALMTFEPDEFVPKYLHSLEDVAEHRSLLRQCDYGEAAIQHLAGLVWERVSQNRRKNLIYGLQAIKWLLQSNDKGPSEPTTDLLFDIYKHFIFDPIEDIRWCVSAILRDKILRLDHVKWLLENVNRSEHLVNRLVRYPMFHPLIADWARSALMDPTLHNRAAELLGRLIVDDLPPESNAYPSETLLWAIYYSCADTDTKRGLIVRCTSTQSLNEALRVCLRLGLVGAIRELRDKMMPSSG